MRHRQKKFKLSDAQPRTDWVWIIEHAVSARKKSALLWHIDHKLRSSNDRKQSLWNSAFIDKKPWNKHNAKSSNNSLRMPHTADTGRHMNPERALWIWASSWGAFKHEKSAAHWEKLIESLRSPDWRDCLDARRQHLSSPSSTHVRLKFLKNGLASG